MYLISDYTVKVFLRLEENLKRDIEDYYDINLEQFIKHIPLMKL